MAAISGAPEFPDVTSPTPQPLPTPSRTRGGGTRRGPQVARIRTEGLGKRYGGVWAVRELDLSVSAGEVFGFLGPNGAGKSTTIRLLLGLARPTAGRAWLAGHRAEDVVRAHEQVAYVPADVALWPQLTGRQVLELVAHVGPRPDPVYREQLVDRFDLDLDKRCGTYSSGNRQKVALVAAFATRAPVLILDEPTSGLDPLMERAFRVAVGEARDAGQTVFVSSHQLAEVEAICDRVAILRAGELVEVAGLDQLRRLRRVEIDVRFAGDHLPLDAALQLPGVAEARQVDHRHLVLQLTGGTGLGPVLRRLADADPVALGVREPTLEEIFLEYYGDHS
jgi:ABC-2 type transport system ATP-binding protein